MQPLLVRYLADARRVQRPRDRIKVNEVLDSRHEVQEGQLEVLMMRDKSEFVLSVEVGQYQDTDSDSGEDENRVPRQQQHVVSQHRQQLSVHHTTVVRHEGRQEGLQLGYLKHADERQPHWTQQEVPFSHEPQRPEHTSSQVAVGEKYFKNAAVVDEHEGEDKQVVTSWGKSC